MAKVTNIQTIIHELEQGKFAPIIKGAMVAVAILFISLLYLFVHFRGLSDADAMDQAQIARSLASGEGFSTNYIRPAAIWQLNRHDKEISPERFPDITNMPLWPAVTSIVLRLSKGSWELEPTSIIYVCDRLIAVLSVLLFLASVGVAYFLVKRIFDGLVAGVSSLCLLGTDLFWQYSLSGLPQMFMLLLFLCAMHLVVSAMENKEQDIPGRCVLYLGATSLVFGLLTLTQGVTAWIFLGFLAFALIYFRPRVLVGIVCILAYAIVVTPWLWRNYQVAGDIFGMPLSSYYSAAQSESVLRSLSPDFSGLGSFKNRLKTGILQQMENLLPNIGMNVMAGFFFVALLHPFRRHMTSYFRWGILLMWGGALVGMAFFGSAVGVRANNLNVLFIPLFVCYGVAFALVLWNRLEIKANLLRLAFLTGIVLLSSVPLILILTAGPQGRIHWPPYIPPYIGILGKWSEPNEVICSDMPWATAWYAQRKSLLIPDSVRSFNEINDYRLLKEPIVMLYLTPISGNKAFIREVIKGPYKEWASFIMRMPIPGNFPLRYPLPLPIDGECVLYADSPRWEEYQRKQSIETPEELSNERKDEQN